MLHIDDAPSEYSQSDHYINQSHSINQAFFQIDLLFYVLFFRNVFRLEFYVQ